MRLILALGLFAALLVPSAARAETPLVDCAERAEPSPPKLTDARWIVAGPVAWPRVREDVVTRYRGGAVGVKRGVSVDAGPTVSVRVLTPGAALIYRQATRLAERPGEADPGQRGR